MRREKARKPYFTAFLNASAKSPTANSANVPGSGVGRYTVSSTVASPPLVPTEMIVGVGKWCVRDEPEECRRRQQIGGRVLIAVGKAKDRNVAIGIVDAGIKRDRGNRRSHRRSNIPIGRAQSPRLRGWANQAPHPPQYPANVWYRYPFHAPALNPSKNTPSTVTPEP